MPQSFIVLMILEIITVLAITFLPLFKVLETFNDIKGCCGMNFSPKKIKIGNKKMDISNMKFIIDKHHRMSEIGMKPIVPLHEELSISKKELESLLIT